MCNVGVLSLHLTLQEVVIFLGVNLLWEEVAENQLTLLGVPLARLFKVVEKLGVKLQFVATKGHVGIAVLVTLGHYTKEVGEE
jgi:hypothetical protein